MIYQQLFYLDQGTLIHTRQIYGVMDLLGDIGGVLQIFVTVFSFVIQPIAEHSFQVSASESLFKVKTRC